MENNEQDKIILEDYNDKYEVDNTIKDLFSTLDFDTLMKIYFYAETLIDFMKKG